MPTIDDVYGTDLFYDGDLHVTAKGDFQEVSGEENLRRAILRRLATNPGEYRVQPTYGAGVPSFLKKPLTRSNTNSLRTRIIEQIQQDRRVDKVITCDVTPYTFDGVPGLLIDVTVQALGRSIHFQPFGFAQEV